jgi:hypothetical protein
MDQNAQESTSRFSELLEIDVSKFIERKGAFSYLSWPFAVAQLRQADPEARWDVIRFSGLPYLQTEVGYFVEVAVTVGGVTLSQIHPVLDAKNNPIAKPSAFHINTSIQRCLVKAIALHGLGLQVYAGEDLPLLGDDAPPVDHEARVHEVIEIASKIGSKGELRVFCRHVSHEEPAIWSATKDRLSEIAAALPEAA